MSNAVFAIKLDEYVPDQQSPGASSSSTVPAAATAAAATSYAAARKSDRACDFCRKRKTRCDGALTSNSKCTNCRRNQCPCTYVASSRPRGPSKSYITALEDKVERFQRLLKRLHPDNDFSDVIGPPITLGSWKAEPESTPSPSSLGPAPGFGATSMQRSKDGLSSSKPFAATSVLPPTSALLRFRDPPTPWADSSDSQLSSDEELGLGLDLTLDPATSTPFAGGIRKGDMRQPKRLTAGALPRAARATWKEWEAVTAGGCQPVRTSSQPSVPSAKSYVRSDNAYANGSDELDDDEDDDTDAGNVRFHGKSGLYPLLQATRKLKRETNAGCDTFRDCEDPALLENGTMVPDKRRPQFWTLFPWEVAWEKKRLEPTPPLSSHFSSNLPPQPSQPPNPSTPQPPSQNPLFIFPHLSLVLPLLSAYFNHSNVFFPLLHSPTFHARIQDGLHLRDHQFAAVVWCVMAIGSRWSDNPQVLWDGWGSTEGLNRGEEGSGYRDGKEELDWASAGWRFFLRSLDAPSFTVSSLRPPTLFDVQACALASIFLRGSSVHPAGWTLVGIGLRKAVDVGAHRKKVYGNKPSIENELWKRAFWVLVLFDRLGSASLGRPCCIREEDFDLDLPLEVDDDNWVTGLPTRPPFVQPSEKPSVVSGFVAMLKLSQIMAYAIRTIYSIDKSKVLLGLVTDVWQERIVSQLNVALDEWVDCVPKHLRWSAEIDNPIFLNQSSVIYTTYYLALILIYRPFVDHPVTLTQPDAPTSSSTYIQSVRSFPFPAFAICTTAARSAIVVLEETERRSPGGAWNIPNVVAVAQMAAGVLLMRVWDPNLVDKAAMAAGHGPVEATGSEKAKLIEDIRACERLLNKAQAHWIMARKFLCRIRESLPSPPGSRSNASQYSSTNYAVSEQQGNWDLAEHQYASALAEQQLIYASSNVSVQHQQHHHHIPLTFRHAAETTRVMPPQSMHTQTHTFHQEAHAPHEMSYAPHSQQRTSVVVPAPRHATSGSLRGSADERAGVQNVSRFMRRGNLIGRGHVGMLTSAGTFGRDGRDWVAGGGEHIGTGIPTADGDVVSTSWSGGVYMGGS